MLGEIILLGYLPLLIFKKIKSRNLNEKLKESVYVTEKEKIRVYLDNINETTRRKHR